MNIMIRRDGEVNGPYPLEQVKDLIANGTLSPDEPACAEGSEQWMPVGELTGASAAADVPPVIASEPAAVPAAGDAETYTPTGQHEHEFRIECKPDYGYLTVQVPANQTLQVEAAAMATMTTNMQMKTKIGGGFTRMLSGESIFINEYTAQGGGGEIGIAPGSPGDMAHVHLGGSDEIYLQSSGYVASGMNVNLDWKWQGCRGFFSGESMILMRCTGQGDLWFNTYGAIIEIPVDGDYVVDTGYIVAFTGGLHYNVESVGGLKSLFFSGEGLVCRFRGQGKLWIQTRHPGAFASWTWPFRPPPPNND